MRRRIHKCLTIFFLWFLSITSLLAQNGQFDVRFTVKNFACDSSQVTIAVQVRAHDMAHTFNMGDANYRFEYDPRLINTPKIVSQEHYSNLAPSSDFNYGPQNLNGSSVTPSLGLVSLNTFYTGVAGGARLVDTAWTTVSCIRFNVVSGINCFPIVWHDDHTFPVTGMNEVELLNDGSYDLFVVNTGGVFTNLQACYQNSCGMTGTPPTVTVTPIVTKQDSTVTVCMPISDPDAFSIFTATVCGTAKHGTAAPSVLTGGQSGNQLCVRYVPTPSFAGADSVCIRVCDNTNKCTDVKIPITVTLIPRPPTITVTPIVTKEDSTVTVCMPISDPDPSSSFTTTVCGTAKHGTATPSVGGQNSNQLCVRYVPMPTFSGIDSVCVRVCDNTGLCTTVIVPITVNPRPHLPTVTATPIVTKEDSTVTVCLPISDPDANSTFTYSVCGSPKHGTVRPVINGNQVCVTYTPVAGFSGKDSVCLTICDNTQLCVDVKIPITVTPKAHSPVVTPTSITTKQDSTVTVCTLITDLDSNTTFNATVCGAPQGGTVSVAVVGNQLCVRFVPNGSFIGQTSACVRVCDDTNLCVETTVPIRIDRRPTPPFINPVVPILTREDSTATVCMPIGDLTPNAPYSASICGQGAHGTAVVVTNGSSVCVTYTPNAGYIGTDQVCIRVCEAGTGLCSSNTLVPVVVVGKPHAPTVTVTPIYTQKDSTATVCMPISDQDAGSTFTATLCATPLHGTATPSVSGNQLCVRYVPTPNYGGSDNVCVRVCDNTGLCTDVNIPVSIDSSEQRNGLYDVRITVKDVLCDSSKANISVEVRAKTMANTFLMGDANYRFKYDPRQIRNPRLLSQINFSNIAPARDFNYGPQNLNGSSAGTTAGLVSLNTYYTGVNQSAKRVDTAWQTVSCIQFDIVQIAQCFDIKWNDGQTFPITGMSEVVVSNPNPFDYNVYIVKAGAFTNLNACPQTVCIPRLDTPSVPVTLITTSRDSTVKRCYPIIDADVRDAFRVSICGVNHGQVLATDINDRTVCLTYKANNSYVGPDTICLMVCDSFGLCRRVLIPVIISDCPDNAPPTITCPNPIRVNIFGEVLSDPSRFLQSSRLGDTCYSAYLQFGMPTATDDCGLFSVSLKSGLPSGSNFPGGVHNLVFEAVDKQGKKASCYAQIEVVQARLISSISLDSVSLCLGSSVNFSTRDLGAASYLWKGPNGFVSISRQVSLSNVSTNQTGKYKLTVTKGFCIYEDSVYVTVTGKPVLVADVYQMAAGQTSLTATSVLLNDSLLRGPRYTIRVKNGVTTGGLSFNPDGTFTFVPPIDFRGTATFVYEVCYPDCPSACQTAVVTIKSASNQRVGGKATNVITPNGDGVNDELFIENYDPTVDTQSQITIYNQWGDVVFRATPYLNNWAGTYGTEALPDGTYYFVFLKSPDSEPIKDFVTIIR